MSDTPPVETPPVQVTATSVTPPATPAVPEPVDPLAGMTPEQVDELAARIEQARANRPPSLSEAIQKLQDDLTGAHRTKEAAVNNRKEASAEADAAVQAIQELKEMMLRTELTEAATVAGFKAPSVVAGALLGKEGDVTTLIAEAAKSGAYAMVTPAKSADLGGVKSQTPADMDPGIAALIEEVRQATGR